MPVLAILGLFLLAACTDLAPVTDPRMQGDGDFRPLTEVPERPHVTVPLYQRATLEEELKKENTAATRAQYEAGMIPEPTLPESEPAEPAEVE